jgi:hypothetical protein
VTLEIEIESGVVDPLKLHRAIQAIERGNGIGSADTDRWIVRRTEISEPQERGAA